MVSILLRSLCGLAMLQGCASTPAVGAAQKPQRGPQMTLPGGAKEWRKEMACTQSQAWIQRELKKAFQAQKSYMSEYDLYTGFDHVGYEPAPGGRYTICNNAMDCRPCTAKEIDGETDACGAIGPKIIGCKGPIGYGEGQDGRPFFRICGTGNLDDDDTLDVWSIDDANKLVNEVNDCEQ